MKKTILFLLFPFIISAQTQMGGDIFPEVSSDQAGWYISSSSDGLTIAIGGRSKDAENNYHARGRVYTYNGESWTQKGQNLDINELNNFFATKCRISLSSDGNTVAIATPNYGPNKNSGIVKIFRFNNNQWEQKGQDIIGESTDNKGYSISISADGNNIAVVASGDGNYNNLGNFGNVTAYQFDGTTWQQKGQKITGSFNIPVLFDMFQGSVSSSADGNIIALGCSSCSEDTYEDVSGVVKIYQYNGTNWQQVGNIANDSGYAFGQDVSLSSDGYTVAIGKIDTEIPGTVKVYNYDGGQWLQKGQNISGGNNADFFGNAVSLSSDGNSLAIGSPRTEIDQYNEGRVALFSYGENGWVQTGENIDSNASNAYFGTDVALSASGDIIAASSPFLSHVPYYETGIVKAYDFSDVLSSDIFVEARFSVYPNPTQKVLSINMEDNLNLIQVNIYNTLGQLIKKSDTATIDVSDLAAATYYIQAITDSGKATKTFIKE